MSGESWIVASLGADRVQKATDEAELRRLSSALGTTPSSLQNDDQLRFAANVLKLDVLDATADNDLPRVRRSSASAFRMPGCFPLPNRPVSGPSRLSGSGAWEFSATGVPTFRAFCATRTWGGSA